MKIKDLNFDKNNYNDGNEFGNSLIEKSLRNNGAGRSILLDKNNNIIAGNKTAENAGAIGLDDVVVVDSDGTKLIAVRRTDVDIHSKKGKELALADNATSKSNITWNHESLKEDWEDDELKSWGITPQDIGMEEIARLDDDDYVKQFNAVKNDTAKSPIVAEFLEDYNAIIIVLKNEIDELYIRNLFGITETFSSDSGLNNRKTNVITVEDVKCAILSK